MQISLGDARSYYVTTARNDLGVIFATSEDGNTLDTTRIKCSIFYRRDYGTCVVARDALSKDGKDRKTQVCKTGRSMT